MRRKESNIVRLFVVSLNVLLSLMSCEKNEPENIDFNPTVSEEVVVEIRTTEIGGDGLKLVSSRDNNSPMVNNSFNTVISKEGAQLLYAVDKDGKIRGLTLTTQDGRKAEGLKIDALSTVISLVFISPGIITIDFTEASQTMGNITQLKTFDAFKSFVQEELLTRSLDEITKMPSYKELISNCLLEYYDRYSRIIPRVSLALLGWNNDLKFTPNADKTKIEIHNRALRSVNVVERDLSFTPRSEIDVSQKIYGLKGAPPFSWGSVITLSYLLDHTIEEINYQPVYGTYDSEFYVVGPSFKKNTLTIPQEVAEIDKGWVDTALDYIIWPLFDLWWGAKVIKNIPPAEAKIFVGFIKSQLHASSAESAMSAENIDEAQISLINFTQSVLSILTTASSSMIPEQLSKDLAVNGLKSFSTAAGELFMWGNVILAGGNLVGVATNLSFVDMYTKFYLNQNQLTGSFIDARDGNTYETIMIGDQIWMAENLRYLPHVSPGGSNTGNWVYDYQGYSVSEAKKTANYYTYGALYTLHGALGACPDGWHLPSKEEWDLLETFLIANGYNYDGTVTGNKIGKALASPTGWQFFSEAGAVGNSDYPEKINITGFTALPAGIRLAIDGSFDGLGRRAVWWTSSYDGSFIFSGQTITVYHSRVMYNSGPMMYGSGGAIENGASIRCIKN